MKYDVPRVVIAAVSSGCGKTTVVTGLLSALRQPEIKVQSYKIGPDYIDPGYHRLASGQPAHNMDTWLMPRETMVNSFIETAQQSELAVIEGVMGLYDGADGMKGSSAEVAELLDIPVVLVLNCKSMAHSVAPLLKGYLTYRPQTKIAGVILNNVGSSRHEEMLLQGPYPLFLKQRILSQSGHLANHITARFLAENNQENWKRIFLCHLSNKNNTPERVASMLKAKYDECSIPEQSRPEFIILPRTRPIDAIDL